jgi:hypothetical protein
MRFSLGARNQPKQLKNKGIECGWGRIPQKSEKGAKDGNPAPHQTGKSR